MEFVSLDYKPVLNICVDTPINKGVKSSAHTQGFIAACRELGLDYQLEAKTLKIFHPYYSGRLLGGVSNMIPSSVSSMAVRLTSDKNALHKILFENRISVPGQKLFLSGEYELAFDFFEKNSEYSVIKPLNGSGGKGITVGVSDSITFKNAWDYCIHNGGARGGILLEERVRGFDIRAVMVGDHLSCAVSRVPAHVMGDGLLTVSELIKKKNVERNAHPHHRRFPIVFPNGEFDLSYRPEDGEFVFLSNVSNIHQGGEAIDVTNHITPKLRNYLVKIMRTVPGLNVAGIDLMIKDFTDLESLRVIEINTAPNYGIHYTPYKGVKRNPAKDFVQSLIHNL